MFSSRVGTPIDPGNLFHQQLHSLLRRPGLPRIRFHDLCYTAATLLQGQGKHPKVVSEMPEYASAAIT